MISKKMEDALNEQVAAELFSAHLYLAMSSYLDSIDLQGFAHWMRIQYQEEVSHALKIFDYVAERDGRAVIKQIDEPQKDWASALETLEATYGHEQLVTGMINKLMETASSEKDHATQMFLQWFITEQVEEEATARGLLQQLKLAGNSKGALFHIDRELGQRVFTPPSA